MAIEGKFREYLTDANNIYDLIGNCFGALCDHISNHQMFISTYMDKTERTTYNPNIDMLNDFSEMIMTKVNQYKPSRYNEFQDILVRAVDGIELETYGDMKCNQLTVIYSILTGIDAGVMNWSFKWRVRKLGPLDKQHKTAYRVYLKLRRNIHDDYIFGVGRERALPSTFFEHFQCFRFIHEPEWKTTAPVPNVKYLSLPPGLRNSFPESHRLKIAVLPVSYKKNFRDVKVTGSAFRMKYSEKDQKEVSTKICGVIESAVNEGSNIIVLPEYTVSPCIYKDIRICLKKLYKQLKSKDKLLLVFAGSTWTADDNNVMHILNTWGEPVGEYYKYSPYTKRKNKKEGFEMYERLSSPGKICDVIAVEDTGLFLPSICRDMIDCEYTEKLSKYLLPLFVVIAAWSSSVASFKGRQEELANKYFISTVLGNGCGAVAKESVRIGNGSIIHKLCTVPGSWIQDINRAGCYGKDGKCKGCYYILDYDFTFENEDDHIKKNTELYIFRHDQGLNVE